MANKKIKHIIAKLVGASTEETFDIYDETAVHTDKIADNLTTTASGYVLDARQGKALMDALTYKLAYDGTDMTAKTLPTGWSEALVWVSISASSSVLYSFHVLSAVPMTQVVGYQMAQAGFTYAQITSSSTSISFDEGMYQNARYTPKRWVIWYR